MTALGASQVWGIQITMKTVGADGISGDGVVSGNYWADPVGGFESILDNYVAGQSKDAASTRFWTFCLEYNEHFSANTTYDVELNNGAKAGGAGGNIVDGKDIISVGTAYLYENFAQGTLGSFIYDNASAAALQDMIWYLEGEKTLSSYGDTFTGLLTGLFGSLDNAKADYTGTAVGVMNLTQNGYNRQDQLVFHGSSVPDGGATLALLGLGLTGLAVFKRRVGQRA